MARLRLLDNPRNAVEVESKVSRHVVWEKMRGKSRVAVVPLRAFSRPGNEQSFCSCLFSFRRV